MHPMRLKTLYKLGFASIVATAFLLAPSVSNADFVINDDLIVDGSACVGFDCVDGESFGFDTIKIKEHNLRIKFDDTSTAASFPSNDWQLTANDSANGGAAKFSIDDITGGRTPFTIEAGARSHSLYVDDGGRIGSRTSTPSTEIHTVDGDTPTLRLQQDGSSGFAPQTWDVAGNETNFFVRDVTNGSQLPLRIRPGAPTSSIDISADGNVGIGTASPGDNIEIQSVTSDNPGILFNNPDATAWTVRVEDNDTFDIVNPTIAGQEFSLDNAGNLTLAGSISTTDCSPCVSDYVFEPDYSLMPLDELETFISEHKHLPNVPSQTDVDKAGHLNMTEMQMKILEKVEELALYTLEQEKTIKELKSRLAALETEKAAN